MDGIYAITIINRTSLAQTFWCFYARPAQLEGDSGVYASSSSSCRVAGGGQGSGQIVLNLHYQVGVGASDKPVGRGVVLPSAVAYDAAPGKSWFAVYHEAPPHRAPELVLTEAGASAGAVEIDTNAFDRSGNEAKGWFSNQSFGLASESGFNGMTWSPSPWTTVSLTPSNRFYIAVGDRQPNALVSYSELESGCATVSVPDDFREHAVMVTHTETGDWSVRPGMGPGWPSS